MKSVYRTPLRYFDLIEAFPQPGCALCRLLLRGVEQFIDSMLYEFTNTNDMHAAFSASRGMCSEHGHLLRYNKQGNVLAIARLYRTALDDVLAALNAPAAPPQSPSWAERLLGGAARANNAPLADRLEPETGCIACDVMAEYERDYVGIICRYAGEARFQEAFQASDGLCLPHFRQVTRALTNPDDTRALVGIQTAIWQGLRAELETFIDKQNYEHIGEPIGREGDSWVRAIMRMAGEKGVFGIRRT